MRIQSLTNDLKRAGIHSKWWVVNSSIYAANTTNTILKARAGNEAQWIKKVNEISNGNFVVVEWVPEEVRGEILSEIIK